MLNPLSWFYKPMPAVECDVRGLDSRCLTIFHNTGHMLDETALMAFISQARGDARANGATRCIIDLAEYRP